MNLKELIANPALISQLTFEEIDEILRQFRGIIKQEDYLISLSLATSGEEIVIIGDIHGNISSLLKLVKEIEIRKPKYVIFLGDIVDRGDSQLECLVLVFILKVLEPERYHILRGNHETLEMNQIYGFLHEFSQKFQDPNKFYKILSLYEFLPLCAVINDSILCVHGGIPEDLAFLKKLRGLKPISIEESTLKTIDQSIFQVLWNDPNSEIDNFKESYRGSGAKLFGEKAFERFMKENNLKYLIRAHECFPEGYRWFFHKRLLSIFSSENYKGDFGMNPASYAIIKNKGILKLIPMLLEFSEE